MQNVIINGMLKKGYELVDANRIKSKRGVVYNIKVYLYGTDLVFDITNMKNNKVPSSQKVVKDLIEVGIANGYAVPKCRNTKYRGYYMIPQRW